MSLYLQGDRDWRGGGSLVETREEVVRLQSNQTSEEGGGEEMGWRNNLVL